MKKPVALAISIAVIFTGCATASRDILATHVSPIQYQSYSCSQIAGELGLIHARANQLSRRLDKAAENDKKIAGAGAIIFWPALFALGGTKEQEAEYARLKGESDALQRASISKRCSEGIVQQTSSPRTKVKQSSPPRREQKKTSRLPPEAEVDPRFGK